MGAFFTNVQVKVGNRSPESVRSTVLEALTAWARDNGFEQSDSGRAERTDEALRTILVAPADSGQWISVYDELTETQHEDVLLELCTMLSRTTQTPVVGIYVHDSDVLGLLLADNGAIVDHYVNDPEYFAPLPPEEKRVHVGRPELWRSLLIGDATPDRLRSVWDLDTTGAEELLEPFAQAVGIPSGRCLAGFNYLSAEMPDPPGFAKLQFRWTHPVSEEPGELAMMLATLRGTASGNPQMRENLERLEARFKQFTPTDVGMALKSMLKWQP